MKKNIIGAALAATALSASAGIWFNPSCGVGESGNWDDLSAWYTWYFYTEKAASQYASATDVHIAVAKTAIVNTDITKLRSSYWSLDIGSNLKNGHRATLRVENGGNICGATSSGFVSVGVGRSDAGVAGYGLLDVRPGGTFSGWLKIGYTCEGIVTNAGTIALGDWEVGVKEGVKGTYVHEGGTIYRPYPKDIQVGIEGEGLMLINSGKFEWTWYVEATRNIGYQRYGCGTTGKGRGTLVIENGAEMDSGITYLGGDETRWGEGRIDLHGGTFYSGAQSGKNGVDTLWIGAGPDENGSVRAESHGEIRGWGKITCQTYSHTEPVGICARLGNGAIIADGQGVERTLDCSQMWQVTNALFCSEAERTNGWYAVNKGALILPGVNAVLDNGGDEWGFRAGSNAVGCCRSLRTPDLINAAYINVYVPWKGAGKSFGVMVLASDRSDAHADKIDKRYAPIGFWKAGVFDSRTSFTEATHQNIITATIDFRYDHHKIQNKANRLFVMRWNESEERWVRLRRYETQPDNYLVSSGEITTTSGDPVWGIGLFCVAEQVSTPGAMLIMR